MILSFVVRAIVQIALAALPFAALAVSAGTWPHAVVKDREGRTMAYFLPTAHRLLDDNFAVDAALDAALTQGPLFVEALPDQSEGPGFKALLSATPVAAKLSDKTRDLLRSAIASGRIRSFLPTAQPEIAEEVLLRTPVFLLNFSLVSSCDDRAGPGRAGVEQRLLTRASASPARPAPAAIDMPRADILRSVDLAIWDQAIAEQLDVDPAACAKALARARADERMLRCGQFAALEAEQQRRAHQGDMRLQNAMVNAPDRQRNLIAQILKRLDAERPPVVALGALHLMPTAAIPKALRQRGYALSWRVASC